ncbi:hypothetical protein [Listeria booriae]|uniref:hypothetical protein n=1 Tax=Listeria booriae TaxID=1552123 RepID=UPI001627EC35|nr:hypothetical protein [Listeria booriae]MBC1892435.1 hypothetical protein [Listeria booriae]MBC1974548.1 hypothetical protein [Listeria booriae]MBC1983480.1 hypothetical protein [Listeria booriae]MBC2031840.1 hypothetical protein [Listeria booriae]
MKQFIIICHDSKDVKDEINSFVKGKETIITSYFDQSTLLLGHERYSFLRAGNVLDGYPVHGWKISQKARLFLDSLSKQKIAEELRAKFSRAVAMK